MSEARERQHGQPRECATCPARCNSVFGKFERDGPAPFDPLRSGTRFEEGQLIEFEKNGRPGFFCIEYGSIRLNYRRASICRPVLISGPGDLIGYGSWYWDYRTDATAMEPVSACFFERDPFLQVQSRLPSVSDELIKYLCRVVLQESERITVLQGTSVKNRVAATLTSLERKFGAPSEFGSEITVKVDRKTLAELSGTVVERLAGVLTELEEGGLIQTRGWSIHICNKDQLNQIAFG